MRAVAAGVLFVSGARADDVDRCLSSYEEAQRSRQEGKLRKAREQLAVCAVPTCPAVASRDCIKWLREVDEAIPSIVPAVVDAAGKDVVDARVLVDGQVVASHLSGSPLPLDPGAHRIRIEREGSAAIEETFVLRVGEKNRRVDLRLPAGSSPTIARSRPRPSAASAPEAASSDGTSAAPLILGGVGVVALGAFAYLGLSARSELDDLDARCGGHCSSHDVDPVRRKALFADVALGVSVLSFAGAAYFALREPDGGSSASRPAQSHGVGFRITSRGGGLSLSMPF
jgi:hypothetical protein